MSVSRAMTMHSKHGGAVVLNGSHENIDLAPHTVWGYEDSDTKSNSSSFFKDGSSDISSSSGGPGVKLAPVKYFKHQGKLRNLELNKQHHLEFDASCSQSSSFSVDGQRERWADAVVEEGDDGDKAEEEEESGDRGKSFTPVDPFADYSAARREATMKELIGKQEALLPGSSEYWSIGSLGHNEGNCKSCHFFHSPAGCASAKDCLFCHLPHASRTRPRPCKTKRLQCKRFADLLVKKMETNPDRLTEAVHQAICQSSFMQGMVSPQLLAAAQVTLPTTPTNEQGGRGSAASAIAQGQPPKQGQGQGPGQGQGQPRRRNRNIMSL